MSLTTITREYRVKYYKILLSNFRLLRCLDNCYNFILKGVRVQHGSQERVFRLEFVSNQEFTENEYQKWIEATTAANNPMPTKENILQKQADIREAVNYEFNEQDVVRMVSDFLTSTFNFLSISPSVSLFLPTWFKSIE